MFKAMAIAGLLAGSILALASEARAEPAHAFKDLPELDQVALILAGVAVGEHSVGAEDVVMTRTGEGIFEIKLANWTSEMGYREVRIVEAGPCKYGMISRLMEKGRSFSRQNSMADLGAITELRYSAVPGAPQILTFTGSNLSLANYFGDLRVYAVQSPAAMDADAKHFLDTVC